MNTLQSLRSGLDRAWDNIAEGWAELREFASHAVTRFKPTKAVDQAARGNRWGLLAAEVSDDRREIKIRIEAPGMEPDDFELEVVNRTLLVSGEKSYENERSEGQYHLTECAYGRFERAIPLPAEVDEDEAQARYRHGVLQVTLPKRTVPGVREIPVNTTRH